MKKPLMQKVYPKSKKLSKNLILRFQEFTKKGLMRFSNQEIESLKTLAFERGKISIDLEMSEIGWKAKVIKATLTNSEAEPTQLTEQLTYTQISQLLMSSYKKGMATP